MAFSGAQTNIVCSICDKGNLLKWKCVNCKELLCDACKVCHEKLETCIRHHDRHHFEPIEDLRRVIKVTAKELINQVETKIKSYAALREQEEGEIQKIKKELKERKQYLISIVESKYGKLTTELHEMYQNTNKQPKTDINKQSVTELKEHYSDKQAALEAIMETENVEELVKRFSVLKKDVNKLLQNIPDVKQLSFRTGDSDIHFAFLNFKPKLAHIREFFSFRNLPRCSAERNFPRP